MDRSRVELLLPRVLVALPALGLAIGGAAWFAGAPRLAATIWAIAILPVLAALAIEIIVSLRRAEVGLDIVRTDS